MRYTFLMAISLLGVSCGHKDLSEELNEDSSGFVSLDQLKDRGINGYYVLETDDPYNGEVIDYYENNQIKYRVQIEFGFKEGLWISWYQNGQKKNEGNYSNGAKDGLWNHWHKNGNKSNERNWNKGKPHGSVIEWYGNGQKSLEQNFKNGKYDGFIIRWHQNGQMMSKIKYQNDQIVEGSAKYWNSKGEPVDSESKAIF